MSIISDVIEETTKIIIINDATNTKSLKLSASELFFKNSENNIITTINKNILNSLDNYSINTSTYLNLQSSIINISGSTKLIDVSVNNLSVSNDSTFTGNVNIIGSTTLTNVSINNLTLLCNTDDNTTRSFNAKYLPLTIGDITYYLPLFV
jgi:hypothetical protein